MKANYYRAHPSKKVKRKKIRFKPNSEYIERSTQDFFKDGGKITKVVIMPEDLVVSHPGDILLDQ